MAPRSSRGGTPLDAVCARKAEVRVPDAPAPRRAGILDHAACIRYADVVLLQGSPVLGAALAARGFGAAAVGRGAAALLASLLLVAHVFAVNDWANLAADASDPARAAGVFTRRGVSPRAFGGACVALLGASLRLFALLGGAALLLAAGIAARGAAYSHPPLDAKGRPGLSSLAHLGGGGLHFLLGYSVFAPIDRRAVLSALFFGLTFAAGHLNQEVRDHAGDLANGIRTNAVAFGRRAAFFAGLVLFTLAYADLALLASRGVLPLALALVAALLYPAHVAFSVAALREGLTAGSVRRFQARYRALYALLGAAMLAAIGRGA
ncbi:MAG TPA: UbiA family prenyltransferase [Planctomycetota bacterium]|nr:UbiA family prenyltransferase [Planctomycetota bacterium]